MRLPSLKTLFVGRQFQFLPVCDSTNAVAHAVVVKNDAIPEGLTILADHQTAGRGQRGNVWAAAPGLNLTFSVVLRPVFLPIARQFDLSIAVALAGYDTLRTLVGPATPVAIKWPNDLYVGSRKIGGILIENALHGARLNASIIGIGLNVNQTVFDPALPNPTSLAREAGRFLDREPVLTLLLEALEARYLALRAGRAVEQRLLYLSRLYRLGQLSRFAIDGSTHQGRITGIDERGQLLISFTNGQERAFGVQDVRLLSE